MNHRLVSVQDRCRGAINGAQRLALVGSPVIQPRIICSGYPPSFFFHPVCRPSGPLGFCFALLPRPSTSAEGVPALRAYPIGGKQRIPRRCVSTASESDGTRPTRPLCKLQGVASSLHLTLHRRACAQPLSKTPRHAPKTIQIQSFECYLSGMYGMSPFRSASS